MPPRLGGEGTSRGPCTVPFCPLLTSVCCARPRQAPQACLCRGSSQPGSGPCQHAPPPPKRSLGSQTSNSGGTGEEGPGFGNNPGSDRKQPQMRVHCVLLSKEENLRAACSLAEQHYPRPPSCAAAQRWLGRDQVINSPVEPYSVVLILNCNQAGGRLREGRERGNSPEDWSLGGGCWMLPAAG